MKKNDAGKSKTDMGRRSVSVVPSEKDGTTTSDSRPKRLFRDSKSNEADDGEDDTELASLRSWNKE